MGKTHLVINLALELVRRGHLAGVFHDAGPMSSVDEVLGLPQAAPLLRRAEDDDEIGVTRQGYQGLDILSCEIPVKLWSALDVEQRARCTGKISIGEGYDDFLIDTSGMDARSQLACCRVSAVIMLMVTPEPQSQAEAFALLRVLQLNGYSGELWLIVNKVLYLNDSLEIFNNFSRLVKTCLGLDCAFLGGVPEDRRVTMAQTHRHAFSSLFPDSEAAAGVVALVDRLDDISTHYFAGPQTLPAFLDALVEVMQTPPGLPGGAVLENIPGSVP